jgi:hypothetical protein
MAAAPKYEFKVSIEGIDLDAELLSRINGALQRALLTEVASIEMRAEELAYRPIMSELIAGDAAIKAAGNGGSTGGAAIRVVKLPS